MLRTPLRHKAARLIRHGFSTIALVVLVASGLMQHRASLAEIMRIGGTGAALGTMNLLGTALSKTDPRFAFEIVPNLGSSGGLKALARDAVQLAVISRPLKAEETGSGLTAVEYGKTPFVLATARKDIGNLTLAQIADIYAGKRETWPDGTPIRLVLRPANDGDTGFLAAFSPAIKEGLARAHAKEGMVVGVTDQDSANEIQRLKGGLGTSSLALIQSEKRPLSAISIEGVAPSVKTLADKTYPYYKAMYFVTKGKASGAVVRFIEFTRSPEGRRILADTGHWVDTTPTAGKPAQR